METFILRSKNFLTITVKCPPAMVLEIAQWRADDSGMDVDVYKPPIANPIFTVLGGYLDLN